MYCALLPGDPPQAAAWIGQCSLYMVIVAVEKTLIILVLLIPSWTKAKVGSQAVFYFPSYSYCDFFFLVVFALLMVHIIIGL